jgi:hypothetical protein
LDEGFMDLEQKQQRHQVQIRAIYDLTMGILWTGAGLFLLFHQRMGFEFDVDQTLAKIFGGTAIVYGLFRLYRGIKSRKQN